MPRKAAASGGSRKRKAATATTTNSVSNSTDSSIKAAKIGKLGGPAAGSKKKGSKGGKKDAVSVAKAIDVSELEARVKADPRNANDIILLLEEAESTSPKQQYKALHALHRLFVQMKAYLGPHKLSKKEQKKKSAAALAGGGGGGGGEAGAAKKDVFGEWLHAQFLDYVAVLLGLVSEGPDALKTPAVKILMDFVAVIGRAKHASPPPGGYKFPSSLVSRVVTAMVTNGTDSAEVIGSFVEGYMENDDVRHYALRALAKICADAADGAGAEATQQPEHLATNVYEILHPMEPPTDEEELATWFVVEIDDEEHPLKRLGPHMKAFSSCWLAFLRLQLPTDIFKNVLLRLPDEIMPCMVDPKLLLDFFRDSYEIGGATSVLALQGVFTLIHKHNLDYPDFYPKLYKLLDSNIFHMKYSSKFFRLVDKFLTSTHLPSYLVAAFIKRFARLSLTTTPAGAMVSVRFIYNLLKRHPSCKVLIHRPTDNAMDKGNDPFVEDENDPAKSNALESSLWEVQSLLQHYHPDVAKLPKVLETPALQKAEMDVRRAWQTTYTTMFKAELKRRGPPLEEGEVDPPPALTFVPPTAFVDGSGAFAGWELAT